jgi:hypothetical protein
MLRNALHSKWLLAGWLIATPAISACVQSAPPELLQAVEALDRQLTEGQGAEFAPEEYTRFVNHWIALKQRLAGDEDLIRWPWEPDSLVADLQQIKQEGTAAVTVASERREARRVEAEGRLHALERRLEQLVTSVDEMASRMVVGPRLMETELLAKQGRTFFHQGLYSRSLQAIEAAFQLINEQTATLTAELGRYADEASVAAWRRQAQRTIEWSKAHQAAAIVVSKADRRLTLYRNGRVVLSYPVRLGYNAMVEKRYQGDGATPEGMYRVIRKRDRGQTHFYRALLLDYPNARDHRRFQLARKEGRIPADASIGGQIEIHGGNDTMLSQTLGCVMLENKQIDLLFPYTENGTLVTIVGALKVSNSVSVALASLDPDVESEEDDDTRASRLVPVGDTQS